MKNYEIELMSVTSGYDGKTCWVHPTVGMMPDGKTGVLNIQKLDVTGNDAFFGICSTATIDRGETWLPIVPSAEMARIPEDGDRESCVSDLKPQWHALSKTMLGIGVRVFYRGDEGKPDHLNPDGRVPGTVTSAWNPERAEWSPPEDLVIDPGLSLPQYAVAGCAQRVDLENGEILQPLYCKDHRDEPYYVTVVRCVWKDGMLTVVETGNRMTIPVERGLYEPSLVRTNGLFLLTLRNDLAGYVTTSADGLNFDEPIKWRFDNGEVLGNYNTQQHWVTRGVDVYLVYTRKGLDNDHVFRHRAPLVMAKVDPENLVVIRSTELPLVPNRGARLGNFHVCDVGPDETWVAVAEWMQPKGCEKYGSDNTVWIARIRWK